MKIRWYLATSEWVKDASWIFTGRTDAEGEAPILWPPDAKSQFIRKDPDAGKDWRQEEKGTTEDEMVGWHHRLDRPEFEQALGVGDGQGSLAFCSPWCHKESYATEQLDWPEASGEKRWHVSLSNWDLAPPFSPFPFAISISLTFAIGYQDNRVSYPHH